MSTKSQKKIINKVANQAAQESAALVMQRFAKKNLKSRPNSRTSYATPTRGLSVPGEAYKNALVHPFTDLADGARIPEPYAQATVTHKIHIAHTITTSATGSFDFAYIPHMLFTGVQFTGSSNGLKIWTPTNAPAIAPASFYRVTDETGLGALYQNYRVVASGVRLKTNVGYTDTAGRVYLARIPCSPQMPGKSFNFGTSNTSQVAEACGIPYDSTTFGISANIQTLPKASSYTVAELHAEQGIEVNLHPVGPGALDWLDPTQQTAEAGLMYTSGAGTYSQAWQPGLFSTQGQQMVLLYGEGLKASTQVVTLEIILHLEGVPRLVNAASGGLAPLPSGLKPVVSHDPLEAFKIHAMAAAAPMATKMKQKAIAELKARGEKFGRKLFGKGMSRAGQLAGDVLGLGML